MIVILNQQKEKRRKGGEANPLDSDFWKNIIKGGEGRTGIIAGRKEAKEGGNRKI